jgi:hypothetical protein
LATTFSLDILGTLLSRLYMSSTVLERMVMHLSHGGFTQTHELRTTTTRRGSCALLVVCRVWPMSLEFLYKEATVSVTCRSAGQWSPARSCIPLLCSIRLVGMELVGPVRT